MELILIAMVVVPLVGATTLALIGTRRAWQARQRMADLRRVLLVQLERDRATHDRLNELRPVFDPEATLGPWKDWASEEADDYLDRIERLTHA